MSTELNSISGKTEYVKDFHSKEVGYKHSQIDITSFNGGIERGRCLQFSIGEEHVQITEDNVKYLIKELINWM